MAGADDPREREYHSKWVTLSATIVVMLSAGMNYTFSMWGSALGRRLGYSVEQMGGLATACSVGSYLNVFPGVFYDRLKAHDRVGPKLTLLVGVACQTVGFLGLWLGATQKLPIPYPGMCLLALIACNCGPWFETGCMVTTVRNFEADRGIVVSLCKSCLGLSAAFYTTLYQATYAPDAINFLLLLGIFPAVSVLLCVSFVNYVPHPQYDANLRPYGFGIAYSAIGALVVYQLLVSLTPHQKEHAWLRLPALAMLLMPILYIPSIYGGLTPIKAPPAEPAATQPEETHEEMEHEDVVVREAESEGLLVSQPSWSANHEEDLQRPLLATLRETVKSVASQTIQREKTPKQCLISTHFWLIFCIHFMSSGTGFVLTSNLTTIVEALDGDITNTAVSISLFSAANAVGRAASGIMAELLTRFYGIPRAFIFCIVGALLVFSNGCMIDAQLDTIAWIAASTGLATGIGMGLTAAVAADCLGMRNLASNYAMLQLAPAISSYVLAEVMFGWVYRSEHSGSGTCKGHKCFSYAFVVMTLLSAVAFVFALLLWWKTVRLYKKLTKQDKQMRQRDTLVVQGRIQQNILASLDHNVGAMASLFTDIRSRLEALGGATLGIKPRDVRAECEAGVAALQASVAAAEARLGHMRHLQEEYHNSGLDRMPSGLDRLPLPAH